MSRRRAILISNPKTGRYKSKRRVSVKTVQQFLESKGIEVDFVPTTHAGHATEIAQQAAADGVLEVIAAGGDGTINEVLQGLIGTNTRLAILPRGTANVLAGELAIPRRAMQAAAVIAKGNTRRIHVGRAVDETTGAQRYFFLMAGIGLDASVVERVRPRLKKHFGKAAFWVSGFGHLADWKPSSFQLEINDELMTATFAAIGKAASYGGDLSVTPRASLDQPDFEVCVMSSQSRLRYLQLLPYVMRAGVPEDKNGVRYLRTNLVKATGEASVQVDGEVIGKLPMSFDISPHLIEVVVP